MHFVSALSDHEQISDIVSFMIENMRSSVTSEKTSPAFDDFESKIKKLEDNRQFLGILEYLLTIKPELLALPVSHKN